MFDEIPYEIILNHILEVLYKNRGNRLQMVHDISKQINDPIKARELEPYLLNLIERGLVKAKNEYIKKSKVKGIGKSPGYEIGGYTNQYYYITDKGVSYVDNGFAYEDKKDYLCDIAKSVADINDNLVSLGRSFDIAINSMGHQNQLMIQQEIEKLGLIEEYLILIRDKSVDKPSKVLEFFKKLSGDVAIALIKEFAVRGIQI